MLWWEKTVEYYFVKQCLLGIDIAPFDGDVEKLGDVLTHNNGKFLLIEFKRAFENLSLEKNKYKDWEESAKAIKTYNSTWLDGGFHIFIFGSKDNYKFELKAHKYWMLQDRLGGSIKDFKSDVDSFKKYNQEHGICKKEFDEYANFLFKQKGGTGGLVNLENSALIASMGTGVVVASFGEYCKRVLNLENSKKQERTIKITPPSRGMSFGR
ncbi:hypothetical protein [uncultured Campylobacter sp.]|uniref:hypothetical protein n=1 Tax=uncultured Campylobacter sp. TaxID=218934 RepID=UPI00261B1CA2|nr:hypothetical protein [uncultured Campylobacter sp.]